MAAITTTPFTENQPNVELENKAEEEECEEFSQECKSLLRTLPKEKGWIVPYIYLYQDNWFSPARIQAIYTFQKQFQAKDSDIVIATLPKAGTTWLKALVFAIVSRNRFSPSQKNHPLLISNAHDLVPYFEFHLYEKEKNPDLCNLPEPRLFGTHVSFHSLPDSISKSKCKIIYICRNPFDNFVSLWFFKNALAASTSLRLSCEEALERYSQGVNEFGPFWTNILGYWRESIEAPNKVLFLKYEDLKGDIKFHLKRIAEFLNCPFDSEEEGNGIIESIIELCSFEKMKELEVNKTGKISDKYENKVLFRKGEVGDWVNHFKPWMVERLSKVVEERLGRSGLSF
ncbi:cytosolic sulfotransferase 15-like [Neltuma alba]|uniref:cytosolic sulfotransferase 15-like n=1 Tax=Neltuma alba TaxID=207710 RepID=UPI0010A4107F|nr:cytosolic sulfotransferase 15-like [Prosopis alba]